MCKGLEGFAGPVLAAHSHSAFGSDGADEAVHQFAPECLGTPRWLRS